LEKEDRKELRTNMRTKQAKGKKEIMIEETADIPDTKHNQPKPD